MELYIGMLIFGGLTGNLVLSIGWILLKAFALLDPAYELITAGIVVIVGIVRKFIRM